MRTDLISGNAVPRVTGQVGRDVRELYRYLFGAMEQLRFVMAAIAGLEDASGRLSAGGGDELRAQLDAAEKALKTLAARVDGLDLTHRIPFGHVDAGSTATVMTATVPGVTKLEDGTAAYIVNGVVTSASGFTLNVNGLGALPVYGTLAAATRSTTIFNINYTMLFVYNSSRVGGGCWDVYYGYNSNDNTLAYNVRTERTDRILGDRITRYMFLFTQRDGRLVPSYTVGSGNGTTATTKTLNTSKAFDPKRPIFYYSTTTNVASGNSPGGSYLWRQYYACEMRYAFNAGTTLTANQPVYLRCVPQSDGTVTMDGNDCLVQSLENVREGKVYIYLGMAYGSTGYNMELDPEHPCYIYTNGALTPWNG